MKKIIGILLAGTLALFMFMNTDSIKESNSNIDLNSLTSLNSANAECKVGTGGACWMTTSGEHVCIASIIINECEY